MNAVMTTRGTTVRVLSPLQLAAGMAQPATFQRTGNNLMAIGPLPPAPLPAPAPANGGPQPIPGFQRPSGLPILPNQNGGSLPQGFPAGGVGLPPPGAATGGGGLPPPGPDTSGGGGGGGAAPCACTSSGIGKLLIAALVGAGVGYLAKGAL